MMLKAPEMCRNVAFRALRSLSRKEVRLAKAMTSEKFRTQEKRLPSLMYVDKAGVGPLCVEVERNGGGENDE